MTENGLSRRDRIDLLEGRKSRLLSEIKQILNLEVGNIPVQIHQALTEPECPLFDDPGATIAMIDGKITDLIGISKRVMAYYEADTELQSILSPDEED